MSKNLKSGERLRLGLETGRLWVMKYSKIFFFVVVLVLAFGALAWNAQRVNQVARQDVTTIPLSTPLPGGCTPTFADGGGPYYQPNAPFRQNIAPENHTGEKLIVQGKVLAADCQTIIPGTVLDIWQANESGSYEDEWYRGQITVAEDGSYMFETVIPQGYGQGTGYRPPHIHFKAYRDGQLIITSQMFLPAARNQQIEEAYIMQVESQEQDGQTVHQGYHDIVLPI